MLFRKNADHSFFVDQMNIQKLFSGINTIRTTNIICGKFFRNKH